MSLAPVVPSRLEIDVLVQINEVRADPAAFVERLREYRSWFQDNLVYRPTGGPVMISREGVAAVDEAIAFLERQPPLPPLSHAALLALAAQDHAEEQGAAGTMGHASLDGSTVGARVQRRGGDIYVGEIISYGFADSFEVVRQFVVDDGVPGRGHRKQMFDNMYRYMGVGCTAHMRKGYVCVVDMSRTADGNPVLPAGYVPGGGS
ncbi:MAG: CAP domain-containing protein [Sphingomonas sp.]